MRDALSLTDQVLVAGRGRDHCRSACATRSASCRRTSIIALLDLVAERRAGDVFAVVARLADAGIDFGQFLTGLGDMLRALLAVTLGGTPPEVSDRARAALERAEDRVHRRRSAAHAVDRSRELEPRFRKSGQQQLLLETLLVRFALLDRTVSLEACCAGSVAVVGRGRRACGRRIAPRRAAPSEAGSLPRQAERPRSDTPAPDWRAVIRDAERAPAGSRDSFDARGAECRDRRARLGTPLGASPPRASRAEPVSAALAGAPDLNRVVERWDDVVGVVRAAGRRVAAHALEHAAPAAVTASGDVTLALDEANPIYEQAIEAAKATLVSTLRRWFPACSDSSCARRKARRTPPTRLTDEMVRAERIAALRRKRSRARRGDRRARSRISPTDRSRASLARTLRAPDSFRPLLRSAPMADFMKILQQAQEMQGRFQKIQEELRAADRDRLVRRRHGHRRGERQGHGPAIKIDPSVVNPADVEMLEDLVLVAVCRSAEEGAGRRAGGDGQAHRRADLPFKLPF